MAQLLKMWLWGGVFLVKSTAVEERVQTGSLDASHNTLEPNSLSHALAFPVHTIACLVVLQSHQYRIAVGTSSRSSTLRACQQLEQVLIQDSACFYAEVELPGNLK